MRNKILRAIFAALFSPRYFVAPTAMLKVTHLIGFGPSEVPVSYPSSKTTLDYTGSDQSYVVPADVTRIRVKCWGAGAMGANSTPPYPGGGGGGYAYAELSVTPGETLTVVVGKYGGYAVISPDNAYGGGGAARINSGDGISGIDGGGGGGASSSCQGSQGGGAAGVKRSTTWLVRGGGAGGAGGVHPSPGNVAGQGGGKATGAGGTSGGAECYGKGGASIGDSTTNGEDGQGSAVAKPGNYSDSDCGGKGYGGTDSAAATHGRVVIY